MYGCMAYTTYAWHYNIAKSATMGQNYWLLFGVFAFCSCLDEVNENLLLFVGDLGNL